MILALVTAFKGLELYQYDGWMFHRSTVKASSSAAQGLIRLSTFTTGDKRYLGMKSRRNICCVEDMIHGESWKCNIKSIEL